jgi:hypothetical protein
MAYFFVTDQVTGTVHTSRLYNIVGSANPVSMTLPSTVFAIGRRPDMATFGGFGYLVGTWSGPLTIDPVLMKVSPSGVPRPTVAPVLATSGTGITGTCLGYFTFVKYLAGGREVESDLGPESNSLVLSNQGRSWSGMPINAPNASVTHIRGYVSVNGALPRRVWEREIGVTTVTENIATLALGIPAPNNGRSVIENKRGVPPYSRFIEIYHERAWYAGNPSFPQRIWFSAVSQPEHVDYELDFIDTLDGEPVTGIQLFQDTLVVFCHRATYIIQGYTEADFVIHKISPSIGCISHHSIVHIYDRLWFAAEEGIYTYNGAFTYMMEDLRDFWKDDYRLNISKYEDSIGGDDRFHNAYKLRIPGSSSRADSFLDGYPTFDYVCQYAVGVEPVWSLDVKARTEISLATLPVPGSTLNDLYSGDTTGMVRKENVQTNYDDAGDIAGKLLVIWTPHYLMGDPGGNVEDGFTLQECWSYMVAEDNGWGLGIIGGDEDIASGIAYILSNNNISWNETVAASALNDGTYIYTPKTVHMHSPEHISGRGFSFYYNMSQARPTVKFRGLGGYYGPGPASRPPKSTA